MDSRSAGNFIPATLQPQQLHRCTARRCKRQPWGCWRAPRRSAHTLRPGWCGNHWHVPQPVKRWRCTKQTFYFCITANNVLRLEFSRIYERTRFVLWHCCWLLYNALASHDSSSVATKFRLTLLLWGSLLYQLVAEEVWTFHVISGKLWFSSIKTYYCCEHLRRPDLIYYFTSIRSFYHDLLKETIKSDILNWLISIDNNCKSHLKYCCKYYSKFRNEESDTLQLEISYACNYIGRLKYFSWLFTLCGLLTNLVLL